MLFMGRRNYSRNAAIENENKDIIYGADGYIHGQGGPVIKDLRYGTAAMGGTACELIAIYNSLNRLGCKDSISKIADYYENNPGMWLFGLFGTKSKHIPDYFRKYSSITVKAAGPEQAGEQLDARNAAIITFWNPHPPFGGIHTVMLALGHDGGIYAYNFFNDSREPARFSSVAEMLSFRGKRRFIRAFIISGDEMTAKKR